MPVRKAGSNHNLESPRTFNPHHKGKFNPHHKGKFNPHPTCTAIRKAFEASEDDRAFKKAKKEDIGLLFDLDFTKNLTNLSEKNKAFLKIIQSLPEELGELIDGTNRKEFFRLVQK